MSRSARSSRRRSTTSRRSSPASSPPLSLYSSDFSENENVPAYTQRDRYLSKPEFVPAIPDSPSSTSSSDSELDGKGLDTAAARRMSNPLDPLRRGNCMLQLFGAGALALGSTLVVALYVTGPPRMHDIASASTAVLFMTLFLGCAACVPSWAAALLILLGKKPKPNEPPPHGKLLRLAALCSFFLATLYSVATLVLFVLLQTEESFVSFCLRNISSATKEDCEDRWNRDWVMGLVVGIVWIFHTALGFPIYRYTRGTEYGKQLESGFLLELGQGATPATASRRSSLHRHFARWDSSEDSDYLPHLQRQRELVAAATKREKRAAGREKVAVREASLGRRARRSIRSQRTELVRQTVDDSSEAEEAVARQEKRKRRSRRSSQRRELREDV